jgi:hypothetical protein
MLNKNNAENLTEPAKTQSFINYLVDIDDIIWMEAGWDSDDESIDSFAYLLYEIHSGKLMTDSIEFIKSQCSTIEQKEQYRKLLVKLNDLFFVEDEEFVHTEGPVVSPTQVFPQ